MLPFPTAEWASGVPDFNGKDVGGVRVVGGWCCGDGVSPLPKALRIQAPVRVTAEHRV